MGVTHYKTSIVTQYTMSHRPSITPACLEDIHSQVINNRYPINDSVLIENYLVIYGYPGTLLKNKPTMKVSLVVPS